MNDNSNPFENLEIPNTIRAKMREAMDLGRHADEQAFSRAQFIIDNGASDPEVCLLAFASLAVGFSASICAMSTAIEEAYPGFGTILRRHIAAQMSKYGFPFNG